MTVLTVDWVSLEAAQHACKRWHYTKLLPRQKTAKLGVWENGVFIGVIVFGVGASAHLSKQYGLSPYEVCELVRIALNQHKTPVTRLVSIALKMLRKENPGLRVCVSFADPSQGHYGGIYQGGNWVYTGKSADQVSYFFNGAWRHVTHVWKRCPKSEIPKLPRKGVSGKFRYVMPFDSEIRAVIEKTRKEYPKRAESKAPVLRSAPGREKAAGNRPQRSKPPL